MISLTWAQKEQILKAAGYQIVKVKIEIWDYDRFGDSEKSTHEINGLRYRDGTILPQKREYHRYGPALDKIPNEKVDELLQAAVTDFVIKHIKSQQPDPEQEIISVE